MPPQGTPTTTTMATLGLLQVEARCFLQAPAVGQAPIFLLFQWQACVGIWGGVTCFLWTLPVVWYILIRLLR